jgi:hypothetical protein
MVLRAAGEAVMEVKVAVTAAPPHQCMHLHIPIENLTDIPESIAEKLALLQLVAAGHQPRSVVTTFVDNIGGFWGIDTQRLYIFNATPEEVAWFDAQLQKQNDSSNINP